MLRRSFPLGLLVLVLIATGCGGGGGDSGPQTKESFINDADAVCARLASQFADAGSQQPGTPQEIADASEVLADLYSRLAEQLSDVRLPDAGSARTQAEGYVTSVRNTTPVVARLRSTGKAFVAAAKTNDAQKLAVAGGRVRMALDAFRAVRATSDGLAVDYGLDLCGNLN